MLPVLAAPFAKPIVKYGVIAGVLLLLVGAIWWHGYMHGKEVVQREWDATVAAQAAESAKQVVKAEAMAAQVVRANDQAEREIRARVEQVKKEVASHAKKNPAPLSTAAVAIYDRLVSLPNEAGRRVPATDPGAGAPEVPRGGVAVEATARVSLDADGETVELTTDELVQAAVDFAEKYALLKNAYQGFSEWNDGRERIELERMTRDD